MTSESMLTPALRRSLTAGLVIAEALGAIEMVVVAAIMPAVLEDVGGLEYYAWSFSAYMLATVISIPIAGRSADRRGPALQFILGMAAYLAGLIGAAASPTMLWLVGFRAVQGIGAGIAYAIAMGVVAKAYPEKSRPRVLALLSFAWVVPGLVGPAFGAFVASRFGWRWSFVIPIAAIPPVLALTLPALRRIRPSETPPESLRPRYPLLLGFGAAIFVGSLSQRWQIAIPAAIAGLAIAYPGLREILPKGTLTLRVGLPAAVAASFIQEFALFGADAFVPLMLTEVRGRSLTEAGVAVSVVTVGWAAGAWIQSRITKRYSHATLARFGSVVVVAGIAGMGAAIFGIPLVVSYVVWGIGGIGMGMAFTTIMLAVMEEAPAGGEATATAAAAVSGTLGGAIGPGLAGAGVALAHSSGAPIDYGLIWVFSVSIVAASAVVVVSSRISTRRRAVGAHISATAGEAVAPANATTETKSDLIAAGPAGGLLISPHRRTREATVDEVGEGDRGIID